MSGFSARSVSPDLHIDNWPRNAVRLLRDNEWGTIQPPTITISNSNITCQGRSCSCSDENCGRWRYLVECDVYAHGIGVFCRNMQLQLRQHRRLALYKVAASGGNIEYGVVVKEHVQAGELLCEYLGEVRLRGEFDDDNGYVMALEDDLFLDARDAGTISRYVNHSCSPNSIYRNWLVPCGGDRYMPRVGLYALEPLSENTVVTADYRLMSHSPGSLRCQCGSSVCQGFVDSTPWSEASYAAEDDADEISSDADAECDSRARSRLSAKPTRRDVSTDAHRLMGSTAKLERAIQTVNEAIEQFNSQPCVASSGRLFPATDNMSSHGMFVQHGWKYLGIDPDAVDVVNQFTSAAFRHHDRGELNLDSYSYEDRKRATWTVGVTMYGRPFIGAGQSKVFARRQAIRDCLSCLLLGGELNPTGPAPMAPAVACLAAPPVCAKSLEDFCIFGWKELRDHRAAFAKLAGRSGPEFERDAEVLTGKLVAAFHTYMTSPKAVLEYMGVDYTSVHKGMPLEDPAGDCLISRRKRLEIGSESRLAFAKSGYIVFKTRIGAVLAKVGQSQRYDSVQEALAEHKCTPDDIVIRECFEMRYRRTLTPEALAQAFLPPAPKPRRLRRQPGVYACTIQRVLWPLRSAAEVEFVMEVLERQLSKMYPPAYVKRMRLGQSIGSLSGRVPEPSVAMTAVPGTCLSSALAATTMGRTFEQWRQDQEWARGAVARGALMSPGFMNEEVAHETWSALRRVYNNWRPKVERELMQKAHREIQWGVDEWTCTGSDPFVNDQFYNAIAGTSLSAEALTMPTPRQGLSAIATVAGGEFLQQPEYRHILLAEAITNDAFDDIVVSGRLFLSTDPNQPSNVLHVDDLSIGSLFWTVSCNTPSDYPAGYACTVAATAAGSFDTTTNYNSMETALETGEPIHVIRERYPGISGALYRAYGSILDLLPHELYDTLVPMGAQCVGGWSAFSRGPLVHGSPGTWHVQGADCTAPRIVYLQTLTVGGRAYCDNALTQLYYFVLFELYYGTCCFLFILHVVDLALVQGLNIADRVSSCAIADSLDWATVGLNPPWDRCTLVSALIEAVLLLLVPRHAKAIVSSAIVFPGDYVKVRKRSADRLPRKARHRITYARSDVYCAVTRLWVYLNSGKGRSREIDQWLQTNHVPVEGWAGRGSLDRLLRAYRLITGELPVDGEVEGYYGESKHSTGYTKAVFLCSDNVDLESAHDTFTRLNPVGES